MKSLLSDMDIKWEILPDYEEGAEYAIEEAFQYMRSSNQPFAFLVRRQNFLPYKSKKPVNKYHLELEMNREKALECIIKNIGHFDAVVSTTGFTSREVYEIRESNFEGNHSQDFIVVGGMGHCSSIAMGIALQKKSRQIWCLDGDGAALMHLGSITTIG